MHIGITSDSGSQSFLKLSWKRKGSDSVAWELQGGCPDTQSLEGTLWMRWRPLHGCGEVPVSSAANQGTPLLIPSWEVTAHCFCPAVLMRMLRPRQPPLVLFSNLSLIFKYGDISPNHLIVYLRFTLWLIQCWLPNRLGIV